MFGAEKGSIAAEDIRMDGKGLKVGIVQARFNLAVTDALCNACKLELLNLGVSDKDIHHVSVPGALEVPVALQALAEKSRFDALVAIGCIIRGETYHFELVANESGAGVSRIALDYQIPIANAILTTEDMPQSIARQDEKGRDAARVAVEMANLLESM
jgi:6,7-dimethyl-8-ribityllumazine synthase